MTASTATLEFLDQLRIRGVELWIEGDRLRYNAPRGVISDDVLNELRKRKTEIIAALRGEQPVTPDLAITPVPRTGLLPLSFAQQRIWFLDELEPDNPFYNVALAKRIRGPLDTALLRRSLLLLIQRHEVLRSTCVNTDSGPRLRITPADAIDPDGDWLRIERLPPAITEAELFKRVNAEVHPPLPLSSVPLIRTRLLQLSDSDAVLTFTTHHFVVDGWSCGVLMRELSQFYAALAEGRQPQLPALRVQYADFSQWQNLWLQGPQRQRQLDYWAQQLDGLGTLQLPTDKPRPPVQSYRGDIHHFSLPSELGQTLKTLSRSAGMTLYMTLLAAFQVLLQRYSQQDEVVLGTAVSNRHSAELEVLLGPFVNTLVLRGDLSGNPTFRELLARTRDVAAGAFAHQDLPFELLVEHLKPERDRSRSPLFQILFVVHQYSSAEELALTGTTTVDYPVAPGTTMYDLFLQLIELDNTFSGSIEYSTDLFERETIERMTAHFMMLLGSIAANPDAPISELAMMGPAEAQRLLVDWNATATPYPQHLQVQQLFEEQAARSPDAIAVACGDRRLGYAALNRSANQLAHYLRGKGIGHGDLVGIYVERSVEMLVALLGILKAGATYVPLDPLFPPERIRFMMEDAELRGLLTQTSLTDDLQGKPDLTLCIDALTAELAQQPDKNLPVTGDTSSLAYVIYTSGSTGQPKGVQLPHRGVVNFLLSMAVQPGIAADDVLVAVTTLSFDIAVLELFLPLVRGARVVIATKDITGDGQRLAALIASSNATIMQATPATWQLLLNANWPGKAGLKILCGGEALPRELADRLLATGAELWNMYGPTETTIWSSVSKVAASGPITVGRPIANTQMYIVDSSLRPVPIGVPGELCIAGDGVARGYFNRPELTAERFVQSPAGTPPGRWYRTGDLARFRSNGEIECLGRNDNQVKIRGYRMELGEIESVLGRHPAVRQTVVTAREDRTGDKRLVAYLIADPAAISGTDLERWKNDQLTQWRDLWQNAYSEERALDPSFNISGWSSSYTGKPIPAPEMREWVEATAARISALQPRRVLEVGSGTGLLVARVAPQCQRYVATDFSPAAISAIDHLKSVRNDLHAVEARQLTADQLGQLHGEQFDLVIINSVAQYFPDQAYFLAVLQNVAAMLAEGGRIFLGDLRSLPLLEAYHTSVQLAQAEADLPVGALGERIQQRIELEEELLFDPVLFQRLPPALPRLGRVTLALKRGETRNEMSCFRYDAVLTLDVAASGNPTPQKLEWQPALDLDELARRLQQLPGEGLLLTGISDARLQPETLALAALHSAGTAPELTAGELRASVHAADSTGLQPEALHAAAAAAGVEVQTIGTAPGRFNALFTATGSAGDGRSMLPARDLTLAQCCNNPMQGRIQRSLVPALKDHLRQSLPEYMVPAVFSLLHEFPLTPNGKIDRKALPAPEQAITQTYTPPNTPTEHSLVTIWQDLLGIDQVGILDDFFGLGGHSLLATQLVARIRDQLQVHLPLNALFDNPTVASLAEAIDTLRLAGSGGHDESAPQLAALPRTADAHFALSYAQQRLWFLDELEPGTPVYNMPFAVRVRGRLDVPALQAALYDLCLQHETLRTVFVSTGTEPVQRILPQATLQLQAEELLSATATELAARLRALARTSFNLATGPLANLHLLKTGTEDYLLVLVAHHIIFDLWSRDVFLRDLAAWYEHHTADLAPRPAAPAIQYADYAEWQRAWLIGDRLQRHVDYWLQRLADAPPVLELVTDRPRPPEPSYRGNWQALRLDADLAGALQALAQSSGCTMFMLTFAAFAALLHKYSGADDLVIGTPISGRQQTALEPLIGFFLNTLALRVTFTPGIRFRELLEQVKASALAAYAHQDLPFEKLVEELQPERDMSHTPVFQHMFIWQENTAASRLKLAGLQTDPAELISHDTAKFDLTLAMTSDAAGIEAGIEYNTDLFDTETIGRMLTHLQTLLRGVTQRPDLPLASVPLLDATERRRIVTDFNATDADFGPAGCVHDLVAQQARKTPDAQAVVFGATALTYAELVRRAQVLAAQLQSRGVAPGSIVAISCERSVELPVAALAVLQAGGCYVPVDPHYPAERIAAMLSDSGAEIVLTQTHVTLPAHTATRIELDIFDFSSTGAPLATAARPQDPLYCIYTSGSTGKPKGVQLSHAGLRNLLRWQQEHERLGTPARTLQFASFSFDVSFQEMFSTWSTGGTLVMVDEELRQDLPQLALFIASEQIERLYLPFAALQPIAETLTQTNTRAVLRDVIVAGEALQVSPAVRALFAQLPEAALHNQYGPSETHVVTALTLTGAASDWPALPSIGVPVANTRAYALDARMQPVPIGVPGELYLGGIQVGIGYLGRPELNAEKFLPSPFIPGDRLYRTGDRVRYRPDGTLEFLGRADEQFKWRGFRIEPGEIEAALTALPGVRQAVVMIRADGPGNNRQLVGYVTGTTPLDAAALRQALKNKLPDYMVPTAIVVLDALPLTPSGKVARRKLPAPEYARDEATPYVAPRNAVEEQLVAIWSAVLGVERAGIFDDFFELGGHSLLATQLVSRVRDQFRISLPLKFIFRYPTPASLAETVTTLQKALSGPAVQAAGDVDEFRF